MYVTRSSRGIGYPSRHATHRCLAPVIAWLAVTVLSACGSAETGAQYSADDSASASTGETSSLAGSPGADSPTPEMSVQCSGIIQPGVNLSRGSGEWTDWQENRTGVMQLDDGTFLIPSPPVGKEVLLARKHFATPLTINAATGRGIYMIKAEPVDEPGLDDGWRAVLFVGGSNREDILVSKQCLSRLVLLDRQANGFSLQVQSGSGSTRPSKIKITFSAL